MQTLKVDPIVQLKNLTKSVITRTPIFQQNKSNKQELQPMILRKPNLSNEKITKQTEIVKKKKETRSKLQQHSTKKQKTDRSTNLTPKLAAEEEGAGKRKRN